MCILKHIIIENFRQCKKTGLRVGEKGSEKHMSVLNFICTFLPSFVFLCYFNQSSKMMRNLLEPSVQSESISKTSKLHFD